MPCSIGQIPLLQKIELESNKLVGRIPLDHLEVEEVGLIRFEQ